MNAVLVQLDPGPVTEMQWRQALSLVPGYTDADALRLAREAHGVLFRNLDTPKAVALQLAFRSTGVETAVVPADQLRLVDAKFTRRIEVADDALRISDPLGRLVPVPWAHVALISVGAVRQYDIAQTVTYENQHAYNPVQGVHQEVVRDVRTSLHENVPWLIEIFLTGGAMRFQAEGAQLAWGYLFKHAPPELLPRLVALVTLLVKHAPHAMLNRGALALRNGGDGGVAYASRPAFSDESAWMLWRAQQPGGRGA
ncbi:MAG: hypothetical protein ABMA26_19505 [Limisphaerales bacterium]